MSRSHICTLTAGTSRKGPTDDGYLSASEVAGLKLDADWVILAVLGITLRRASNERWQARSASDCARYSFGSISISGSQSRNRGETDIVGAGDLHESFPRRSARKRLALLLRGQLGLASELHPARLGAL